MGEKLDKRAMILTAAREVFFEKGYHGATSEEIAKRAGVGKGTLYQYFDSKLEIFLEMHRQAIIAYCDKLSELIKEESSFEENLRRIVHCHVGNLMELSHYIMQFITETPPMCVEHNKGGEVLEDVRQHIDSVLNKLVTNAKRRGEIYDIDEHLIMSYIMGILMGVAHFLGLKKGMIRCEITRNEDVQNEKEKTAQLHLEEQIVQIILHGLTLQKCGAN